MATSKELRERRNRIISEAQALTRKQNFTAADQREFDHKMLDADRLKIQIDGLERVEHAQAEMAETLSSRAYSAGMTVDALAARDDEESRTFQAWMRGGEVGLNDQQRAIFQQKFRAAQGVGTGSAGGYTVPQGFFRQIIEAQKSYGGMLVAGFMLETETGNTIPIPTDNDTANVGALLAENTQATNQDVAFGSVSLGAYTYTSKIVVVSNQLMQDSAFDMDSFLSAALGTRIARAVNTHLTTGTGSSQPRGAVTGAAAGYTMPTGNTATITYDGLIELQHAVDPAYRKKATFMLNDAALKVVKQLKDSQNRPLWLPGLAAAEPDRILGHPYIINQDMAAPAANAKTILFGDFTHYFIRRVVGVQLLRLTERFADFNQTAFVAFQRWDGNLVDAGTNPIKYLAQSAT